MAPDEQHELERQACYQNASNEALNVPNGYLKVAVLIIQWADEIDNLHHKDEVARLQDIFTTKFGYECNVAKLNNSKRPQHQLDAAIQNHRNDHDGPNNLLIVYYTGHGTVVGPEDDERLELSATWNGHQLRPYPATAFWDTAERPLFDMEGDVLAILDCCFASRAGLKMKQEDLRTYQLLAASPAGSPTEGPGKNSFTTALCDSLSELIDESGGGNFPLTKLIQRINRQRTKIACVPWDRLHKHNRQIQLARLAEAHDRVASFENREPEKAYLNFRLSLATDDLEKEQIEMLARQMPKACKEARIPVLRIDWVKMEKTQMERMPADLYKTVTVARACIAFRRNSFSKKRVSEENLKQSDTQSQKEQKIPTGKRPTESQCRKGSPTVPERPEKRKRFPKKKRGRSVTLSGPITQPQTPLAENASRPGFQPELSATASASSTGITTKGESTK
ncbi:hypothetical protein BU23DRAFT_469178 [Bimuria novae-zelandiae CBS 107.79]|uniref:Peptidase C14 caspase domain-containing protein n=1 Tax=Bimuria novae-zelandiae CBS 107.79 TaxID=1447943 RepID=A0A6A5VFW6_9PLEO|nr:hypothetical protein BU23DRAFT_469178 [Bimuria novae-zelandiae CBS 107.79]